MLTQDELGKKAGISGFTISRIESDQVAPRVSTIRKIALALDIAPEELAAHPKAPAPPPLELEERRGGDSVFLAVFKSHMARRARAWDQQADEENSRFFADYRTSMAYAGEVYKEAFVLARTAVKELWPAIDLDFAPEDAAREHRDLLDAVKNMSKAVDKVRDRDAAALERAIQNEIDPAELEEARAARERLAKERRAAFELLHGRWSA
jgi:transcriptional regulator with XRE-family HTH domain